MSGDQGVSSECISASISFSYECKGHSGPLGPIFFLSDMCMIWLQKSVWVFQSLRISPAFAVPNGVTLLHSERPKLYTILAFLSVIGLSCPIFRVTVITVMWMGTFSREAYCTQNGQNSMVLRNSHCHHSRCIWIQIECFGLILLHSERLKLYSILAFLSAIELKFGKGAVRWAILYADRSCYLLTQSGTTVEGKNLFHGEILSTVSRSYIWGATLSKGSKQEVRKLFSFVTKQVYPFNSRSSRNGSKTCRL